MNRNEVLELISKERERQDNKWGYPQKNTLPEWGIILGEEVGEVMKEINELHFRPRPIRSGLVDELIQVAAVAVSIVEHMTDGGDSIICPSCLGTGGIHLYSGYEIIDTFECTRCNGTGRIKEDSSHE